VGFVSEGHGMIVGSLFSVMVRYVSLVYQFLFRLPLKHIEYWLEFCCITCTILVCMITIMIMMMMMAGGGGRGEGGGGRGEGGGDNDDDVTMTTMMICTRKHI
jgi:hypothetical protein